MEFTGKIMSIGAEELVGQNETPKINFILEEEDKEYPNSIAIDVWKDKIEDLKQFNEWDIISVKLNVQAKEYNWRHFNNISAWKFKLVESGTGASTKAPTKATATDDDSIF